ncbi:DNA methyltransferase [Ferrimonas lipolytica]|uniref:site-specific DNA-methyltransferase (cytosine-N(4)-specific) n=1 Tax=Ferrimonas lipolytica TaxID=2724191 RepID=A0A6H1UIM5_9GAMM|nr:DNA methyltransferase [Ferrimonas lipolytica]QIZ78066.1 site-specific DNA-methyltransferase [Ferrimonas lipolytica]
MNNPQLSFEKELSVAPKHVTHSGGKGEFLHDWYAYLEGYSSEFVHSVLDTYMPNAQKVLEPFAGVGTTPLTLGFRGIKTFYSEINPAMRKVINAKLTIAALPKDKKLQLFNEIKSLSAELPSLYIQHSEKSELRKYYEAAFKASVYFDDSMFSKILKIRSLNDELLLKNPTLGLALEVAVISKLIICSRLKRAGDVRFKTQKELDKGLPEFILSVQEQLLLLAEDCLRCPKSIAEAQLVAHNAKQLHELKPLGVDGVITSPPYLNGTNYFRNTKLELWYMGFITTATCLRGFRDQVVTSGINDVTKNKGNIIHPSAQDVVTELAENAYDGRISKMAAGYFEEMGLVFNGLSKHLKDGGIACIDIGDSLYGGIHVPTHDILSEIAKDSSLNTLEIVKLRERRSKSGAPLTQSLIVLEKAKSDKVMVSMSGLQKCDIPTKWDMFKEALPHLQHPYSKRNWGSTLHSVCSYQGKMKPALAYKLVEAFSSVGDKVLDPFSGSGTIPFEAALNGRESYGLDIGLLATTLSNAKMKRPNRENVTQIIESLEAYIANSEPSEASIKDANEVKFNKSIPEYFHEDTFKEILCARDFFIENHDSQSADWALVMSCMMHILHGNRPYALSRNSHPITPYAPTGDFIYKNLIEKLWAKVNKSLDTEVEGGFVNGHCFQADILAKWPEEIQEIDAIITSPPFFDSTKFYMTNWMRYWFCGWTREDFDTQPKSFVEVIQKKSFDAYDFIFNECHERLKVGGYAVFHLGHSDKCNMAESLKSYAEKYFEVVDIFTESVEHCEKHGIADKGGVKGHQYLVLRK